MIDTSQLKIDLQKLGINIDNLKQLLDKEINKIPKVHGATNDQLYISPKLKEVLDASEKEAFNFKDEYISIEHILLAFENISSPVADIFKQLGIKDTQAIEIHSGAYSSDGGLGKFCSDGIVLVGDSCAQSSPFIGLGVRTSIISAQLCPALLIDFDIRILPFGQTSTQSPHPLHR